MLDSILHIQNLNKHFDGIAALDDFSCTVSRGEILGLIGPNGAGKTTLFNVLTGFIRPDSGSMSLKGMDLIHRHSPRTGSQIITVKLLSHDHSTVLR